MTSSPQRPASPRGNGVVRPLVATGTLFVVPARGLRVRIVIAHTRDAEHTCDVERIVDACDEALFADLGFRCGRVVLDPNPLRPDLSLTSVGPVDVGDSVQLYPPKSSLGDLCLADFFAVSGPEEQEIAVSVSPVTNLNEPEPAPVD